MFPRQLVDRQEFQIPAAVDQDHMSLGRLRAGIFNVPVPAHAASAPLRSVGHLK
jgi:hypothetical protein